MVILRLSAGLANEMYEYAAAYALSQELGEDMQIDISATMDSSWGYMMDWFNTPNVEKVCYFPIDAYHVSQGRITSVIPELRKNAVVFYESEDSENAYAYKSINQLDELKTLVGNKNIYLCGYFFDREKYHKKYWEKLCSQFKLIYEPAEIVEFRKIITGKVSVGVHVRRGDFAVADWAPSLEEDYWRAGIAWYRCHFESPHFFVFSDDINYIIDILGRDSHIHYVHFNGYDNADIIEFMCLSICDHRLCSNSSTFSRLADELHGGKRTVLWKNVTMTAKAVKKELLHRMETRKEDRRSISLLNAEIKKYSKKYQIDGGDNINEYRVKFISTIETEVCKDNAQSILHSVAELSLNIFELTYAERRQLGLKKFYAEVKLESFDLALQDAFPLYAENQLNRPFIENLIYCLYKSNYYEEAAIEYWRMPECEISRDIVQRIMMYLLGFSNKYGGERSVLLIPFAKMTPSSQLLGLVELGVVLYHMGFDVTYIFNAADEGEEYYIEKYPIFTNRHGTVLGGKQYSKKKLMSKENGIMSFMKEYLLEHENPIVITRDADFIEKDEQLREKCQYVFPDFSDWRDAETIPAREMPKDKMDILYSNADVILSRDKNIEDPRWITWDDNDHKEKLWVEEERWKNSKEHRLSIRNIYMAIAMLKKCII